MAGGKSRKSGGVSSMLIKRLLEEEGLDGCEKKVKVEVSKLPLMKGFKKAEEPEPEGEEETG